MKKVLIVPVLALAFAGLVQPANADHGGAQSPDLVEEDDQCFVAFVGHATCTVTSDQPASLGMQAKYIFGVPTPDGWHVHFVAKVIDNDTGAVMTSHEVNRVIPYTEDWLGLGVPQPAPPFEGRWISPGTTTNATCVVDVIVGSAGQVDCRLPWQPGPLDPPA